jgi:pimeloyl-ACP methyl ester carboxylesterase
MLVRREKMKSRLIDTFVARAIRLLVLAVVVYISITGGVLYFEEKLLYFPSRELEVTPDQLGLRHEDLRLMAEDGVSLHAWYLPVKDARFAVLLCHGNGGNISHRLDRAMLMQRYLGTDVLLFDYRGYGQSDAAPDEQGIYRDSRAAYRFLTEEKEVPTERVILFGESLGAAVAVELATEVASAALVLEAPFSSIPDMAREVIPFFPLGRFIRNRYENEEKIPSIRVPLLVIHGERDRTVPFEQGRRVFEAAPEPKRFHAISGAGHNDTYIIGGEEYWQVWKEFLNEL